MREIYQHCSVGAPSLDPEVGVSPKEVRNRSVKLVCGAAPAWRVSPASTGCLPLGCPHQGLNLMSRYMFDVLCWIL